MPPAQPTPRPVAPPPPEPVPPKFGFFETHPDLEKFIGENLVSKIGIAILVLAIGFFVKYAIDNDWIGAVGRVGIGILCGGILIGLAHWLRKSYQAFSSVLVGGGLAVLYFTIALAYHQYQLFGQTAAFIIMLVITAFSVALSLLYDRQELAIIALVGGFVTPFLVSNGSGNYKVLFTYLLILNTGLLVIAYNKSWRLLNTLAFGFTVILFGAWLLRLPYDEPHATYYGGFWFAMAFYLLFFIINIAYTIKANQKFIASDFGILLVNTCLYSSAALYMMTQMGADSYKGLFCATMGVFHLGMSWLLFRKNRVDNNILYLFVGITMSFVSLTAPLQLHGHYITLFWASESVLLYWLFLKSRIKLIRLASLLVWVAALVSLMMDWSDVYFGYTMLDRGGKPQIPVVFNKGYLTGLYATVCCWALFRLNEGQRWRNICLLATGSLLLAGGILEIYTQFDRYFPDIPVSQLFIIAYTCLLAVGGAFAFKRLRGGGYVYWAIAVLCAGVLVYLFSLPAVFDVQRHILEAGKYHGVFWSHWLAAALACVMVVWLVREQRSEVIKAPHELFTWLICFVVVVFVSAEGQLLVNVLWYSPRNPLEELQRVYDKAGLPILWGLCSFAFMWLGMSYKFKSLRIVSLVLFSITLLKLFLFDIRNIPVGGKIAAFFCLGVLLLVVSFMYQRLKKLSSRMRIRKRFKCWLLAIAPHWFSALGLGWLSMTVPLPVSAEGSGGPRVEAQLDSVVRTGFYRIVLFPEFVARCKADLGDLRIRSRGGFVPYVLNTDVSSPWNAGFLSVPDPVIRQKDSSDKHSYIWLEYRDAYRIDRLSMQVRGPSLYRRRIRVLDGNWVVADVSINPHDTVFRIIAAVKAKRLLIDIENADNAPLVVSRVAGYQSGIFVLTHLEAGREYALAAGDSLAEKPEYDLHYFTDSLSQKPMDIGFGTVDLWPDLKKDSGVADMIRHEAAGQRPRGRSGEVVVWSALALVLLFLLYFSFKMVKAIGKKESNDRL
ncbi:DUF2339 domain-containing protein [Puia sp. P3]|uniref:DUF2339 domain-containing protein n=1 Tax=Puia sp. P3 TaxID=3423952 RepID=UPI003D67841E